MSKKTIFLFIITLLVLFFMYSITFARSMISGQVVDAETGKPIENAAFYIHWWKVTGPPGLTSGVDVETAEGLTDSNGNFNVPKHSTFFKEFQMAIYKKGHVCWSSEKIFPKWEDRKDFKLKNKMVINLEKFKEGYSIEDHARFTIFAAISCKSEFDVAIEQERKIKYLAIQKEKKESEGKK
jgi:hypothetical protein